jgi:hypothetical protein
MKKTIPIIFLLFIVSCTPQKKTISEQYNEMYNKYHKDEYVWEECWYHFESTILRLFVDGKKEIISIDFKGKISFEKNLFVGTTNEFVLESQTIIISNQINVKEIKTYDSLINNKWYSLRKEKNNEVETKEEKGRNDINNVQISFDFDEDIFYPVRFQKKQCDISISKELNYVSFSSVEKQEEYQINKIYGYFFDKKYGYNINAVDRTVSFESTAQELKIYTSDSYLVKIEPLKIEEKESNIEATENGPELLKNKL